MTTDETDHSVEQAMDPSTAERLAALSLRRQQRAEQPDDRLAPPRRYRGVPDVAWFRNPTVWVGLVAVAGWLTGWVGYLTGTVPAWGAIAANTVANYLGFTVFHESVHRAAHSNRRVNDALGWLPAALLTFTYPVFRICHLNHHAHTNDAERDPDHYVSHRPRVLLPVWLVGTAVNYRLLCYRNEWGTPGERRAQKIGDAVSIAATVVAALTGYFVPVLVLYWAPVVLAGMWLFYAFDYLPHIPFESTERFHDTRIQPGRIRHALLLGQNYHLIHHLWVSVPWFFYREVFNELEPQLRERQIRID